MCGKTYLEKSHIFEPGNQTSSIMQFELMKATFGKFNKGLLLKVHRYTIAYYQVIFNCGSLAKYFLNLEDLFQRSTIFFLIFDFGRYSRSSFYGIPCFSIFTRGSHLDTTITSKNISRSFSIDAIIFNHGRFIMDASLVLETFSVGPGCRL